MEVDVSIVTAIHQAADGLRSTIGWSAFWICFCLVFK